VSFATSAPAIPYEMNERSECLVRDDDAFPSLQAPERALADIEPKLAELVDLARPIRTRRRRGKRKGMRNSLKRNDLSLRRHQTPA
jgi:hypothetical protein